MTNNAPNAATGWYSTRYRGFYHTHPLNYRGIIDNSIPITAALSSLNIFISPKLVVQYIHCG